MVAGARASRIRTPLLWKVKSGSIVASVVEPASEPWRVDDRSLAEVRVIARDGNTLAAGGWSQFG